MAGVLWQARQQSAPQNLRSLEDAIGRFSGIAPRLNSWDDAIDHLLGLRVDGKSAPLPVVIDEVGYLLDADPGFASRLQAALAPAAVRRQPNTVRLILCGSAFGQMRRVVDADAPFCVLSVFETLVESGWLAIGTDPLRSRSSRFVIEDPIVRFHRLVIEPAESRLTRTDRGREVWEEALPLVRSQIFGPHFERLAREWVLLDSAEQTTGSRVTYCGSSVVGTGTRKIQLDVVAVANSPRGKTQVCAIGGVKSGEDRMGINGLYFGE
jgi:uncharacterized protein